MKKERTAKAVCRDQKVSGAEQANSRTEHEYHRWLESLIEKYSVEEIRGSAALVLGNKV